MEVAAEKGREESERVRAMMIQQVAIIRKKNMKVGADTHRVQRRYDRNKFRICDDNIIKTREGEEWNR